MTTANRQGFLGAAGGPSGAGDMLQQAVFALNSGRAGDAERIAGDVLKTRARNFLALHVLGSALLMQGRITDAIAPGRRFCVSLKRAISSADSTPKTPPHGSRLTGRHCTNGVSRGEHVEISVVPAAAYREAQHKRPGRFTGSIS